MTTNFVLGAVFGFLLGVKASKALIKYAEIKYSKKGKDEP